MAMSMDLTDTSTTDTITIDGPAVIYSRRRSRQPKSTRVYSSIAFFSA